MLQFLKPNIQKIVFAFVLLILSSYIWRTYTIARISDTFPHGFPFQFYLDWGPCPPGEICYEFNGLYLIFDLFIWYSISAFVIDRLNKR